DELPRGRVLADLRDVQIVERQLARRFLARGLRALVVAADAVLVEQRALRRGRRRRRLRRENGGHGERHSQRAGPGGEALHHKNPATMICDELLYLTSRIVTELRVQTRQNAVDFPRVHGGQMPWRSPAEIQIAAVF